MSRKLKALGLILGVTALIAVAYYGIAFLIDEHIAGDSVGFVTSPNTSSAILTSNH